MKLTLPIFFNSEKVRVAKDTGIDYNLKDCIINHVTFFNINAISPYLQDDKLTQYTIIYAYNVEFVCKLHPLKVEDLINASRRDSKEV